MMPFGGMTSKGVTMIDYPEKGKNINGSNYPSGITIEEEILSKSQRKQACSFSSIRCLITPDAPNLTLSEFFLFPKISFAWSQYLKQL